MTGLLPDHMIRRAINSGAIGLTPWDPDSVQPCSVDVTLGDRFLVELQPYVHELDPAVGNTNAWRARRGPVVMGPGAFVLAGTRETFRLDAGHACRVEGKSSLGRLGLAIHVTAGWIDPGFHGQVTLELVNHSRRPIRLWPGMKIAQACFFELAEPVANMYGQAIHGSHYQGQMAPSPSRSHLGFTSDHHDA